MCTSHPCPCPCPGGSGAPGAKLGIYCDATNWYVIDGFTPSTGTVNSQRQGELGAFGTCETVSSATATGILAYTTVAGSGGLLTINLVSRATTIGTGIAVGDTVTSTYVLGFKNVAGTVTLSTAGITLVGALQTTAAALTSTLTATAATNVITIKVTNTNLCTVDSQVMAQIVAN